MRRDVPNEKRRDQVEGYRKPFRQCFKLGPGIPKLLGWRLPFIRLSWVTLRASGPHGIRRGPDSYTRETAMPDEPLLREKARESDSRRNTAIPTA